VRVTPHRPHEAYGAYGEPAKQNATNQLQRTTSVTAKPQAAFGTDCYVLPQATHSSHADSCDGVRFT
jgi:hypothetical protein